MGWVPGYEPPVPRGPLSEVERQQVLDELDRLEKSNNERLSRAQESLLQVSAQAGLSELRERLGRPYG